MNCVPFVIIVLLASLLGASTNPVNLPESVIVTDKYPLCTTVDRVHNQGKCSSWGYAVADTLADRICVQSGGRLNVYLSAEDIITCSSTYDRKGCILGYSYQGWDYIRTQRVASGGPYNSGTGCKFYSFYPTKGSDQAAKGFAPPEISPSCTRQCDPSSFLIYNGTDTRFYTNDFYRITTVEDIKDEIYYRGSVQSNIWVQDNFLSYTGGVYKAEDNVSKFVQAVRLIGWGKAFPKQHFSFKLRIFYLL